MKKVMTNLSNNQINKKSRVIVGNTFGEMEMIDLRTYNSKNATANAIKKYKKV